MYPAERKLFFSKDGVVDQKQFVTDLAALRRRLQGAGSICNLFQDRYQFALGIVAGLLNRQAIILPPSLAPEAIRSSIADAPAPFILSDNPDHDALAARLPSEYGQSEQVESWDYAASLQDNPTEIRVYSSGSTKQPKCNVKTWKMLRGGAAITDKIIQDLDAQPTEVGLLGTTPHGHMYGLEATIFATLGFGHATYRDTIFYPADLEAAIEVARACGISKLVLITSPAHLRFLEAAILAAPEIICVLSATAPFPQTLAQKLAARENLKVMEIYGSTETGSMALRQTAFEEAWSLSAGFELKKAQATCLATAPHLPDPIALEDEIEQHPDGRFTLLGRAGDMVSVRGKRSQLAALNAILSEVAEISDGVFLHAKRGESDALAIAVVPHPGSSLSEAQIRSLVRRHLLLHLDAAFVPKKLLFLSEISRSATGKITHATTVDLLKKAGMLN
ncbi:AMP-binding protein [Pseudophaeobacter arcticus]|jgi:acyl-coenzyme A synthetase/AMP-(fatty) acid ligase|uniref:AMP-binding protein n=1 Tax=Pseudophaeobacter arcticus TaxID=385492 RepID=UPI0039E33E7D